jgi:opacity protein-like surface antigen
MRHVFRSLLAGAAVLAAGTIAASAADLGHGSLKDYGAPAPMPVTMSSPSSWYIRGDFSASSFDAPTIFEHDATSEYDLTQTKIGRNWALGAGIGRYLGANTRADITLDWMRKSSVSGVMTQINYPDTLASPTPCADPLGAPLQCASNLAGTHKFDLQSTVGLLNFYYDFGQRGHFSPYVGAGVGFVRHKTSNGVLIDDQANGISGTIDSKSSTQLAGALMTGFSVALRSNMHLDAGYRFLYMGKAETGAVKGKINNPSNANADLNGDVPVAPYDDPTVTDIHAHQFRVGVRYDFGGGSSCGQRC